MLDRLTAKESRIVGYVVQGLRNREIASLLGTTEQVVKNYLRSVYRKLGVSGRLELALTRTLPAHNIIRPDSADSTTVAKIKSNRPQFKRSRPTLEQRQAEMRARIRKEAERQRAEWEAGRSNQPQRSKQANPQPPTKPSVELMNVSQASKYLAIKPDMLYKLADAVRSLSNRSEDDQTPEPLFITILVSGGA